MKKQIGSACLIAGTAIGAGMIALPLVLAQLGLTLSIALMVITWVVMYHTALTVVEVNLRYGRGVPIGVLGRVISGRWTELVGNGCLNLLSFSLLAAYLYGGASVINAIVDACFGVKISLFPTETWVALGLTGTLLLSVRRVDYFNRILFIGLIGLLGVLIVSLVCQLQPTAMPFSPSTELTIRSWVVAVPVVFTAFGFHVVFHTIINYCDGDPAAIRWSVRVGSIIPLLVYLAWTVGVLGVVYAASPSFYQEIVSGGVEVGRLVNELASILKWPALRIITLAVSLLAILTSAVGIGLGLASSLEHYVQGVSNNQPKIVKVMSVIMTVLPSYIVAVIVPGAFIHALSFAGMILVGIAVVIPLYLLYQSQSLKRQLSYSIVDNRWVQAISIGVGAIVVICEIVNIVL